MLNVGTRGSDVSRLQRTLASRGFNPGSADGVFGPRTLAAVRAYQRARGLSADGVVGPNTSSKLFGSSARKFYDGVSDFQSGPVNHPAPSGGGSRVNGYVNGVPRSITVSSIGNGKTLRTDAANAFNRMKASARAAGVSLTAVSGFRTMEQQRYLYQLYQSGRGNLAARPGYSNHQGGVSVDVSTNGAGYSSSAYRWLSNNARRFGFVNDVGGEPWHWTYRG